MTCYTALLLCSKFNINLAISYCRVSDKASSMVGTTASLKTGDIISLENLLYALMLPSGNDAAMAIAEYLGK